MNINQRIGQLLAKEINVAARKDYNKEKILKDQIFHPQEARELLSEIGYQGILCNSFPSQLARMVFGYKDLTETHEYLGFNNQSSVLFKSYLDGENHLLTQLYVSLEKDLIKRVKNFRYEIIKSDEDIINLSGDFKRNSINAIHLIPPSNLLMYAINAVE